MTGRLVIAGLGPGPAKWITPEVSAELEAATDIVGYQSYLDRVPHRPGQQRHGSDNRVELNRAREALTMAAEGRRVVVVSGGDPGVFGMAAAVFEAIETGEPSWRTLDVTVLPGISAMQAAAARLGAPLGHDFCAISLSDNLKPWAIVERRLRAAADGDFVIALFNPASKARPDKIHLAFDLLRGCKAAATPVAFARAIGRKDERIVLTTLGRRRSRHGGHEHTRADRLERNAVHRAPRRHAMAANAAKLRSRPMSLDPREDVVDRMERRVFLGRRPVNDDHLDAQRASCLYLRLGRRAAAVLGDERVDPLFAHQGDLVLDAERSAREDQTVERQRHCSGGSIVRTRKRCCEARPNAASCTPPMVRNTRRGRSPSARTAPAISATFVQRSSFCCLQGGRVNPAMGSPTFRQAATAFREIWTANGCVASMTASTFRSVKIGLEPSHAAEAANTERYRWRQRVSRPAGEGQHRLKVPAVGDPLGQRGCLRRAAKDQKPHLSALRRSTR